MQVEGSSRSPTLTDERVSVLHIESVLVLLFLLLTYMVAYTVKSEYIAGIDLSAAEPLQRFFIKLFLLVIIVFSSIRIYLSIWALHYDNTYKMLLTPNSEGKKLRKDFWYRLFAIGGIVYIPYGFNFKWPLVGKPMIEVGLLVAGLSCLLWDCFILKLVDNCQNSSFTIPDTFKDGLKNWRTQDLWIVCTFGGYIGVVYFFRNAIDTLLWCSGVAFAVVILKIIPAEYKNREMYKPIGRIKRDLRKVLFLDS